MTIDPGTYVIVNAASKTTADLSGTGGATREVHGWEKIEGQRNQQAWWRIKLVEDLPNSYILQNKDSGLYLHVVGFPLQAGNRIFGSNSASFWRIDKMSDGTFEIVYPGSYFIMELLDGAAANGTPIQLGGRTGSAKQRWNLVKITD